MEWYLWVVAVLAYFAVGFFATLILCKQFGFVPNKPRFVLLWLSWQIIYGGLLTIPLNKKLFCFADIVVCIVTTLVYLIIIFCITGVKPTKPEELSTSKEN